MKFLEEITSKKAIILIVLVGLAVYANTIFNGFVWDDSAQIVNNVLVHSPGNIPQLFGRSTFGTAETSLQYYRPMMSSVFAIIYSIFGQRAAFFHLFQILLHILNSILVFYLLKSFLDKKISLFLAIVFLVHPMNVESTAYISSLMEPLFFAFGMVALLISLHKLDGKSKIAISLLLLFSLLAKETGILFIVMMGVMILLFKKVSFLRLLPVATVSLGLYLYLRIGVAGFLLSESKEIPIFGLTWLERLTTIPKIILFYIQTFFLPFNLAILQEWTVKVPSIGEFYIPLAIVILFFMIVLGIGFYIRKRNRDILGSYIFLLTWFLLGLAMHAQIFPLDMTVAERWFYFPMMGLLGMIGVGMQIFRYQISDIRFLLVDVLIISLLSFRTVVRNFDWYNDVSLYSKDAKLSRSANIEFNLGAALLQEEKMDEAKEHFANAIELAPNPAMRAYYEGTLYNIEGDLVHAKESYGEAIEEGNLPLAYAALSNLIYLSGTLEEALEFMESSLKKQPNNAQLWLNLALLEYEIGNRGEALIAVRKAYDLSPTVDGEYVLRQIEKNQPIYK